MFLAVNVIMYYKDILDNYFFKASYTDPNSGLYYASIEEYKKIRRLTPDVVQGYLALRGANRV